MFKPNEVVTRNDTGRPVRIVEVRPVGLKVFYLTEDYGDGHTALFGEDQLRPGHEPVRQKAAR